MAQIRKKKGKEMRTRKSKMKGRFLDEIAATCPPFICVLTIKKRKKEKKMTKRHRIEVERRGDKRVQNSFYV